MAVVFLTIGVTSAIWGFSRLQGEVLAGHVTALSVILLFGGVIVGITAGVLRLYWRSRLDRDEGQTVAMQALGAAGRQQYKKRVDKKNN